VSCFLSVGSLIKVTSPIVHKISGNQPPGVYYEFACSPKASLEYFKSKLSSQEHVRGVKEREGWTVLFIPMLVHNLLRQKIQ
jgi:hypothetical protein